MTLFCSASFLNEVIVWITLPWSTGPVAYLGNLDF